jgi:hypothetical protein
VSIQAQMWEGACSRWRPQSRPGCWISRVHIRCCGNGYLGFRPDGGSLWKSPKVTKGLLPHHSAPRLGSVCPHSGLNPWAAAMGHPWPSAANPASCRVTHGFKPAFGQRGLTGRLRSKADQERLASHRGYSGRYIDTTSWSALRPPSGANPSHWLCQRQLTQVISCP